MNLWFKVSLVSFLLIGLLFFSYFVYFVYAPMDNRMAGPCVHYYDEPSLTIQSVYNSEKEMHYDVVLLQNISIYMLRGNNTLNKYPQSSLSSFLEYYNDDTVSTSGLQVYNVSVAEDNGVVCTLPCSLGTTTGEWNFILGAEENVLFEFSENVSYSSSGGGCPSISSGGMVLDLVI